MLRNNNKTFKNDKYFSKIEVYNFFFICFLTIMMYKTRKQLLKTQMDVYNSTESSFYGVECAYTYRVTKPAKTWHYTKIVIEYNPKKFCTKDFRNFSDNGGSVFRVQAFSVYEMVTTTTDYIGNETYEAKILLTFPTKYILMIILTYVNGQAMESTKHTNPVLQHLSGSPFTLNVLRSQSPKNLIRYCSSKESGFVSGRWIKCGGAISGLERCGAWQTSDFDFDKIYGFRWVPYVCQYHQYTNDEIKRCFARNKWSSIVFAGDSHMRYRAYHWATRLYGSCHSCVKTHIKMLFNKIPRIEWIFDARGTRLPLSFPNISLPLEKYIHPKVRRSKFSTPFPVESMKSKLMLLNFGHWVLRETGNLKFMQEKITAYAEAARILQMSGTKVVWVNTVSLPWRTDKSVVEWKENTSPYRVKFFNQLADDIMEQYGIPVVDAFQISDGRIAATHDQTHYTKKLPGNDYGGVVENAISNAIINLLCN
ncbi:uncharacterized protein LOC124813210 isoform X1 [Hydra vulgaris]|uniref:uncharacterized protein LOC124813210 isoform X1 n=1 Tax=Hydra vulgaris TaxID=6087 RepID=UPI001F5F5D2C|nr:uncharacterized protein LOC124813210 [Hydra vulgaris]